MRLLQRPSSLSVGRLNGIVSTLAFAAAFALIAPSLSVARDDRDRSPDRNAVATWATAPVAAAPSDANRLNNQTLRQIVHTSTGGDRVRVKFSNRYGTAPLVVQAASIALRAANEQIVAGSNKPLTFSGKSSFTVPAFGELYSDWLRFKAPPLSDLAIDLYIPADTSASTSPLTLHNARPAGQLLSYVAPGNQIGVVTFPTELTRTMWYFLTGVDVSEKAATGTVVCFGDSITDGSASTLDANARYPDFLARRLERDRWTRPIGVVNLGIGGNRVLIGGVGDNALARFDRDVLTQSGVTHVIVLEGINDISGGNTAARIIEGHRQLIKRARARGLKIYGATLTPFANAPDAREAERQALNRWIRTSGDYDAVIDFDKATRDPNNPRAMRAIYDSGDTLHPNSAGYEAMANAIDLRLFRGVPHFSFGH